jgi:hypothetical protein
MHSSAHRVSLVPPRAGCTTLLRQAGQPARSVPSTNPCAPQYNTNRSAAFVCPARVSARSSLPTRSSHTKAAPSQRAVNRRSYRYAPPPSRHLRRKGQVPRRQLRYAAFGLPIIFSLAFPLRSASVTAPAEEKARCRAVSSATRPSVSLLSFHWPYRSATPCHGTCGGKGQVPRQGSATRPPVFLLTPYCPGRFKGPFGSPLIAPLPANKATCLILVISISL